jgi:hypothetical protein
MTRELSNIKETLTLLNRRKDKINTKIVSRNRTAALRVLSEQIYEDDLEGTFLGESTEQGVNSVVLPTVETYDGVNPVVPPTVETYCAIPEVAPVESYWEVSESSDQPDLVLILRLFAPACGKLSKSKTDQFAFIQAKNLNQLSKARVDSKAEELQQRMTEIQSLLSDPI